VSRTQQEILDRFRDIAGSDWLGFRREVLAAAMDFDTVRQAVPDAALTEDDRADYTPADPDTEAREYLSFAIEKILGHRGISAERSAEKLGEFAWLLGRDDVVKAMEAAEHAQYGAPKVKAFADGMGWPFLDQAGSDRERAELERMADGAPCRDECEEGCSW
jgi:hypothetical protein